MPIDPRGLEIERWSAMTSVLLQPFGFAPRATDEEHWREYAAAVKVLPAMSARHVPGTTGFTDWRNWAFRLNEALYGLGL